MENREKCCAKRHAYCHCDYKLGQGLGVTAVAVKR